MLKCCCFHSEHLRHCAPLSVRFQNKQSHKKNVFRCMVSFLTSTYIPWSNNTFMYLFIENIKLQRCEAGHILDAGMIIETKGVVDGWVFFFFLAIMVRPWRWCDSIDLGQSWRLIVSHILQKSRNMRTWKTCRHSWILLCLTLKDLYQF